MPASDVESILSAIASLREKIHGMQIDLSLVQQNLATVDKRLSEIENSTAEQAAASIRMDAKMAVMERDVPAMSQRVSFIERNGCGRADNHKESERRIYALEHPKAVMAEDGSEAEVSQNGFKVKGQFVWVLVLVAIIMGALGYFSLEIIKIFREPHQHASQTQQP